MAIEKISRVYNRVDSLTNWSNNNPVIGLGEFVVVTNSSKYSIRVGDGVKRFLSLPSSQEFLNISDVNDIIKSPVSMANIISSHTGDGVPRYPDNPAGTTYLQDNWATVDGWEALRCTIYVSNGKLIITTTDINPVISKPLAVAGKSVIVKIKKQSATATISTLRANGSPDYYYSKTYGSNIEHIQSEYFPSDSTANMTIYPGGNNGLSVAGDVFEIDFIYVGTGANLTPVFDRAGGGTSFTNVGCVPTKGKFGNDLLFNGSSSNIQSVENSIQPPIFHFHCTWDGIENLAAAQYLFDYNSSNKPYAVRLGTSTTLRVVYWNGSAEVASDFTSFFTSTNHTIDIVFSDTAGTITAYKDGVLFGNKTGLTMAVNTTETKRRIGSALKGSLGNIIMRSAIPTAAEITKLYLDPRGVDSQTKSVTAVPDSIVTRDSTGIVQANGFKFPSTQSASTDPNTLDDYEEGTIVSPLLAIGGVSTGITYYFNTGRYVKIGSAVTFKLFISLNSKASLTGSVTIPGLPFTRETLGNTFNSLSICASGVTYSGTIIAYIPSASSSITLVALTEAGGITDLADTNFDQGVQIHISGTYYV